MLTQYGEWKAAMPAVIAPSSRIHNGFTLVELMVVVVRIGWARCRRR
jgi:type II secretory pathway pseudopilin PulG